MRRYLSLILVAIILLSSANVFAEEIDININLDKVFGNLENLISKVLEKFKDVNSKDWFVDTVGKLVELGGINGYTDGTFKPNNTITKAEFTKILISVLGHKDIPIGEEHWASEYIAKAEEINLIDQGEFKKLDEEINRNEMAKIVSRALDYLGEKHIEDRTEYKHQILDFNSIDKYQDYILKAYTKGIIAGYPDGTFKGDKSLTRAEASAVIIRVLDERERIIPEKTKEDKFFLGDYYDDVIMVAGKEIKKADVIKELKKYPIQNDLAQWEKDLEEDPTNYFLLYAVQIDKQLYGNVNQYMDTFFNRDYRNIDANEVKEKGLYSIQNWWDYKDVRFAPEDFVDEWVKDTKENKIIQKLYFVSDESLIYTVDWDGWRLRGRLYFKYFNHENPDNIKYEMNTTKDIQVGKWYSVDIDIYGSRIATNAPIPIDKLVGYPSIERYGEEYYISNLKEVK